MSKEERTIIENGIKILAPEDRSAWHNNSEYLNRTETHETRTGVSCARGLYAYRPTAKHVWLFEFPPNAFFCTLNPTAYISYFEHNIHVYPENFQSGNTRPFEWTQWSRNNPTPENFELCATGEHFPSDIIAYFKDKMGSTDGRAEIESLRTSTDALRTTIDGMALSGAVVEVSHTEGKNWFNLSKFLKTQEITTPDKTLLQKRLQSTAFLVGKGDSTVIFPKGTIFKTTNKKPPKSSIECPNGENAALSRLILSADHQPSYYTLVATTEGEFSYPDMKILQKKAEEIIGER